MQDVYADRYFENIINTKHYKHKIPGSYHTKRDKRKHFTALVVSATEANICHLKEIHNVKAQISIKKKKNRYPPGNI